MIYLAKNNNYINYSYPLKSENVKTKKSKPVKTYYYPIVRNGYYNVKVVEEKEIPFYVQIIIYIFTAIFSVLLFYFVNQSSIDGLLADNKGLSEIMALHGKEFLGITGFGFIFSIVSLAFGSKK